VLTAAAELSCSAVRPATRLGTPQEPAAGALDLLARREAQPP